MRKIKRINYSDTDNNRNVLNVYLPDTDVFDLYIFFHGGGLTEGGPEEIEMSVPCLVENNVAVVSADYRRYPQAHYPDFIEDAVTAIVWSLEHIKEYGTYKRVFVGGTSAGAYISMMLCFDSKYLGKYNISPSDFDGYIFDAGQPTMHFNVLAENKIDSRRVIVNEMAPLYHIGTADNYPPMLFFVSDNDMEGRYEQTMLTIATLKHFGHEFPKVQLKVMKNSSHCLYVNDKLLNSEYTDTICSFIQAIEKENIK